MKVFVECLEVKELQKHKKIILSYIENNNIFENKHNE